MCAGSRKVRVGCVPRRVPRALSWQAEPKPGSSYNRTEESQPQAPLTGAGEGDTAPRSVTSGESRKLQVRDSWGV